MIRTYNKRDKGNLIRILESNIPTYFHMSEAYDFNKYLDNEIEDYFVMEDNAEIIGAGGINYFLNERVARLSWDIVSQKHQGFGFGSQLVNYRIEHIKKLESVEYIVVRTSQHTYRFYEKMGFRLDNVIKDYWAKGFDLYQMKRVVNC